MQYNFSSGCPIVTCVIVMTKMKKKNFYSSDSNNNSSGKVQPMLSALNG